MFPPLDDRLPLPWFFIPSFYLFIIISVALPPGRFRTALTLPIFLYFLQLYGQYDGGGGLYGDRYALGCLVAVGAFKYVDFVVLGNAEGFRRPGKKQGRLWWSTQVVMVALRGYGWTHEVKNVPRPKVCSRWVFVARQTMRFVGAVVAVDTAKAWMVSVGVGAAEGGPRGYDVFGRRMTINGCEAVMTWGAFELITSAVYAVGVSMGFYNPEECPPAWGSVKSMYTVRKMWGETWHQFLRRITNVTGDFVSQRMKRGSFLSRYTKLFAGFFASAAIHMAGAVYGCGHETGNIKFFMSQAVIILIEDHIIAFGRFWFRDRLGWRVVGYCWTVGWLLWSYSWWVGPQLEEGAGVFSGPIMDIFGLIPRQSTV